MKIGLTQIVRGDLSPEEFIRFSKECGYEAVELSVKPGDLVDDDAIQRVRTLADELDMAIVSAIVMGPDCGNLLSSDPKERSRRVDTLREAIQLASKLRVDTTLLHPGGLPPESRYDYAWEWLANALKEIAPEAKEADVVVALEHVWNMFLLSPTEMRDFVDAIDHPNIKVYLDTGNMVTYGYPEQWIDILAHRIQKVHFKDFLRGEHRFVDLTEGDVDWPKVMASLRAVGYDGAVISECGGDKDAHTQTAQTMRAILAM